MKVPARVLIVDDEPNIRLVLRRTLETEGYLVKIAASGDEAISELAPGIFDLVLLDLYMEPVGGIQVLESIRKLDPSLVVIVITAHSSVESAAAALRLGAFDYLLKPATPETIRQRVRDGLAQRQREVKRQRILGQIDGLRRMLDEVEGDRTLSPTDKADGRFVRSGPLLIDRHHRTAMLDGSLLDLTTTELDVLLCLVEASPAPVPPAELVRRAMGYEADVSESRDIAKWHIHQLRAKIEPEPKNPQQIVTVRYKGYLWRGP